MARLVKYKWKDLELIAIGTGRSEDIVAKGLSRRLKNKMLLLWNGNERNHFIARYFNGTRHCEDDVFLLE